MEPVPVHIRQILTNLTAAGYAAYVVGGAVRDLLRGVMPHDYDVATDARPDDVSRVAQQSGWQVIGGLGRNYGVVLLVVDGRQTEVATFRGERYGYDSHRPSEVWYAASLAEDLGRRDFTMNAMALAADGTVIDSYGGRADVAAGIIRAVGDPGVRFAEDGLRMFRACRFAAQLGFSVEGATLAAMADQLGRAAGLSLERVRQELDKLLLAPYAPEGLHCLVQSGLAGASCCVRKEGVCHSVPILPELSHLVGMPQNPAFHAYDCWRHTLETVRHSPPDYVLRWAALLHDVAKGWPGIRGRGPNGQITDYGHDSCGANLADDILTRLAVPAAVRRIVVWLVEQHMRYHFHVHDAPQSVGRWVRAEARSGRFRTTGAMQEAFGQLVELGRADTLASGLSGSTLPMVEAFGVSLIRVVAAMPVHTADVAYDRGELLEIVDGADQLGPFLQNALRRIQDGTLSNDRDSVMAAAKRWRQRQAANLPRTAEKPNET